MPFELNSFEQSDDIFLKMPHFFKPLQAVGVFLFKLFLKTFLCCVLQLIVVAVLFLGNSMDKRKREWQLRGVVFCSIPKSTRPLPVRFAPLGFYRHSRAAAKRIFAETVQRKCIFTKEQGETPRSHSRVTIELK